MSSRPQGTAAANVEQRPAVATALGIVGREVRLARLERGWTLEDLAERAGISEKTVRSVEAGSTKASVGTVFELAWLVGLNLLGRDDADLPELAAHESARLALAPKRARKSMRPAREPF